jgi:prophage maintenance system killer protein
MSRIVHYHHPQAENFSLKYSSASASELLTQRADLDGATKLIGYPFDIPVYVLYEADTEIETAEDIDYDREWLGDRIAELDREGQIIAFRLVELLEAAVGVREEDEFRLYKEFEPQKIQQALDHVSWRAQLPQVAGELMSNLILRHSLPNANHRTGIAMLQFCIESVDAGFEMPRTHVDDDTWREWVDPHIIHSKRLITVRRNNLRFKKLEELDVDLVERKDGIQIRLAEFELDMHWRDALSEYARQHESHCTDFAQAVLRRAERDDLLDRQGPTKQEFITYLEDGLVKRDFREMF